NGDINIGSGGMSRGITIGWMESATGEWNGTIEVDGETLSPDYTQVVTGGGAVGQVPYGAHLFECVPAYDGSGAGAIEVTGTETGKQVTIAHYGYILYTGTGKPFTVAEAAGSHCFGICVHGDLIDKTTEWTAEAIGQESTGYRNMILE